ncbi:peptidylprolyl isomerase [Aquabacterium lacunae]|uniref:peptidylprolyl isomerase n=1 Tax=Aquabacterium lacunae TaxID=2528630 RepID=A0A4Q9H5G8_9BURK|nr:peptidylprolyl isomerase [Aquabacterium lacunae]TBO33954.1 peptidylprolyl isomerase [Aquabacterium lacunae]
MKIQRIAQVAVLAAAVAAIAPAMAQNIAVVNGKGVPVARFEAMKAQVAKQGQQITPEIEGKIKEQLVKMEIFAQEAERRGVAQSKEYREQMEFVRQNVLIQLMFADFEKKNGASEADAKAEYDKFKAANGESEYRARHILVEKEEEAKALVAQLKAGAKFEDLAKKASKDPGSAENGGDLDWATPGNYVPEFSEAMTKLKKGEFTETPVKSQFGFHIIKLEDMRAAQFPSFDEVKGQLMQRGAQERAAKFRDDLVKNAKTDFKFPGK